MIIGKIADIEVTASETTPVTGLPRFSGHAFISIEENRRPPTDLRLEGKIAQKCPWSLLAMCTTETPVATRLKFSIELKYEIAGVAGDFIFNVHAAETPCQSVVAEQLDLSQSVAPVIFTDTAAGSTRYLRLQAQPGSLTVCYKATVDIAHHAESCDRLLEVPITNLPPAVLPYIYPSRYCQSDRLHQFAAREFSHLPQGYRRVQGICDWVRQRTKFTPGSSNSNTSAIDTIIGQAGVCRDFAHLMIALCRAVSIPARFVTGIDYGADPALGPTDFHAYVEVFLGDRWYLFEPSGVSPPMGLVRIGTGRDAADVSFATMFGTIKSVAPVIAIEAVDEPQSGFVVPRFCREALSTCGTGRQKAVPSLPATPA